METLLSQLPTVAVGILAIVIYFVRKGLEKSVETTAEESIKEAFKRINWSEELGRELQKVRGTERQELRFKSYGRLWAELRPLAVYDDKDIDQEVGKRMYRRLSNWYFSECGGLYLTRQSRGFYFALQDLLRITTSKNQEWCVQRKGVLVDQTKDTMCGVLTRVKAKKAIDTVDYLAARTHDDWDVEGAELGDNWRKGVQNVADAWGTLDNNQQFAVLQQVGSVLRSGLTLDLESRMR